MKSTSTIGRQGGDVTRSASASICLVGRHKLFREALKTLLKDSNFEVIYEADDIDGLVAALSDEPGAGQRIDLALIDIVPNSEDILDDLRTLRTHAPDTPVVVLSDGIDMRTLESCLAGGASGYLVKDISLEALLHSLHLVMLGEKVFPTHLAELLVGETRKQPPQNVVAGNWQGLSERERQILQCLVEGDSNKRIGLRLKIAEATVKVHMKSLLRKIKVDNRTQAAIWALKHDRFAAPGEAEVDL